MFEKFVGFIKELFLVGDINEFVFLVLLFEVGEKKFLVL